MVVIKLVDNVANQTSAAAEKQAGGLLGNPIALQRIEGGVVLVLSILFFWKQGGNWLLFLALILAPDLFMAGYVRGPRLGAAVYNLGHTWLLPGILAVVGVLGINHLAVLLAIIWLGHIGMDRVLGYGLKYVTGFKETHLRHL